MNKSPLLLIFLIAQAAFAQWDDCPFGLVNDTAPGSCGRFIDTDGDGICDHSEPAPEDRIMPDAQAATQASGSAAGKTQYNFILITGALTLLYIATFLMSKKKVITPAGHRRIWNLFLLATFLGAGLTGLALAARLDLDWDIPALRETTYWHMETGIAMTIISIFHVLRHRRYYLGIVRGR
ncbi:MAG: hypothetical protein JW724_01430 [Candidatus Altiarchaeota archaeon]|nr:hypothetical protein [Candidatus Altiarchaeota archaeon]